MNYIRSAIVALLAAPVARAVFQVNGLPRAAALLAPATVSLAVGVLLVWLILPAAGRLLRSVTEAQEHLSEAAAPPMDEQAWLMVATVVVEASATASVLRMSTADPKLARTVAMIGGGGDAIGSYADGLAVLLLDCPPAQGDALARRLRSEMAQQDVSCDIVSASKPRDGQVLQDLLAVAEAELVLSAIEKPRPSASSR